MSDWFYIFPDPLLSVGIWYLIIAGTLYMARIPMHRLMRASNWLATHITRLFISKLSVTIQSLENTSRQLLQNHAQEIARRRINKIEKQIDLGLQQHLSILPGTQHRLKQLIDDIQKDYQKSEITEPMKPEWLQVAGAMMQTNLQNNSPETDDLKRDLAALIENAELQSHSSYLKALEIRNSNLSQTLPFWQKILDKVSHLDKSLSKLHGQGQALQEQLAVLNNIHRSEPHFIQQITTNAYSRFLLSGIILAGIAICTVLSFFMINPALTELIGSTNTFGITSLATVTSTVIILLQALCGFFVLEVTHTTRWIPAWGTLSKRRRNLSIFFAATFGAGLLALQIGLIYIAHWFSLDALLTHQTLTSVDTATDITRIQSFNWVTVSAKIGLITILACAISVATFFVEMFTLAARYIIARSFTEILRVSKFLLRVVQVVVDRALHVLERLYDVVIFIPLWLESAFNKLSDVFIQPSQRDVNSKSEIR